MQPQIISFHLPPVAPAIRPVLRVIQGNGANRSKSHGLITLRLDDRSSFGRGLLNRLPVLDRHRRQLGVATDLLCDALTREPRFILAGKLALPWALVTYCVGSDGANPMPTHLLYVY